MRRLFFTATLGLLVAASAVRALDAPATIKKVDGDQGTILVFAGGQDRELKIAADVKVIGKDGKPLAEGIKSKELKEGNECMITVDIGGSAPVLKAIYLGKAAGRFAGKAPEPKPSVGIKPLGTDQQIGASFDRFERAISAVLILASFFEAHF